MRPSLQTTTFSKDQLKTSWLNELHSVVKPSGSHSPEVQARIKEHINRCQLNINDLPTRSMFLLVDTSKFAYIFVSASTEIVLGYTREHVIGNGFEWLFTLLSPDELAHKKQVMEEVFAILKTKQPDIILNCVVRYDIVARHLDGRKVHILEEMMFPEVSPQGDILVTSCFLHDVTGFADNTTRKCTITHETAQSKQIILSKKYFVNSKNESPLSRREKQVLELFSNGLTTIQVANKLYISENTIKTHRKNILAKLKVQNTAQAIKASFQNNWL